MALADPSAPSSDLGLRVLLLGSVTVRAAFFAPTPWPARDAALPPAPTLTLALLLLVMVHARVQRRTLAAPHVAGRTSERRWRCPQHLWLAEAHRRLPLPAPLVDKVSCSDLDEQQQLAAAGGRGTSPRGSSPPTPPDVGIGLIGADLWRAKKVWRACNHESHCQNWGRNRGLTGEEPYADLHYFGYIAKNGGTTSNEERHVVPGLEASGSEDSCNRGGRNPQGGLPGDITISLKVTTRRRRGKMLASSKKSFNKASRTRRSWPDVLASGAGCAHFLSRATSSTTKSNPT